MTGKKRRKLNRRNERRKLYRMLCRGEEPPTPYWLPVAYIGLLKMPIGHEFGRLEMVRWIHDSTKEEDYGALTDSL